MTRHIGRALLMLALITFVIWLISHYVQPILPKEINSSLVLFVVVLSGVTGFFTAFRDVVELIEKWQQYHDQHILTSELGQGPYDKATIVQSTKYYIKPKCSNIDPAQEEETRHALMATKEDLFGKVDYFLDQDTPRHHLLILAESGMGKTSFALNYYAHNARRSKKKRHKLFLIPLGVKNADNLISQIPDPSNAVIFLDALDEDMKAVLDHRARIATLMEVCQKFKRVIITCRTQFFPKDEEIPVSTGISRFAPRKAGERGTYEFWKLYLAPFDDDDVAKYIRKRFPIWNKSLRKKASKTILKIPLLSARPMLLAYIPDVVNSSVEINYSYQLYAVMIEAWLERESSWVNKNKMRQFSEKLAVDIYLQSKRRGSERIPYEELLPLAKLWNLNLEQWQISGRSLLNRDTEGNFKFAHRSIMEYLFVEQLVNGNEACLGASLTDQMRNFLLDMLFPESQGFLSMRRLLMRKDITVYTLGPTKQSEKKWLFASMPDETVALKALLHRLMDLSNNRSELIFLLDNPRKPVSSRIFSPDLLEIIRKLLLEFQPPVSVQREILETFALESRHSRTGILRNYSIVELLRALIYKQFPNEPLRSLVKKYGFIQTNTLLKFNESRTINIDFSVNDIDQVILRIAPPTKGG